MHAPSSVSDGNVVTCDYIQLAAWLLSGLTILAAAARLTWHMWLLCLVLQG